MADWKADPKRGATQVEPRRQEIVEVLKTKTNRTERE